MEQTGLFGAGFGIGMTIVAIVCGGLITLASLAIPAFIVFKLLKGSAARQNLLRTGVAAQAQILALSDTGTTINDNPLASIALMVHPQGAPPFQASCQQTISRLAIPRVQPGAWVQVKFNPQNPAEVTIDL